MSDGYIEATEIELTRLRNELKQTKSDLEQALNLLQQITTQVHILNQPAVRLKLRGLLKAA